MSDTLPYCGKLYCGSLRIPLSEFCNEHQGFTRMDGLTDNKEKTMSKVEIEIDPKLHEGYTPVAYRQVTAGEYYLDVSETMVLRTNTNYASASFYIVFKKIKTKRF